MRNYPHTLTDYRHTDKHLRLVMVLIALYCTQQSREGEQTDGRTDDAKYIIYLATRSIIMIEPLTAMTGIPFNALTLCCDYSQS